MAMLIDADALLDEIRKSKDGHNHADHEILMNHHMEHDAFMDLVDAAPTVDAVEVQDKQLLNAIKLLIKQYEHSKKSDYVHRPVAHAFYHTWKKLDAKMERDGNG